MHLSVEIILLNIPNYYSDVFVASIIGLCFDILLFLFRLLVPAALKYCLISLNLSLDIRLDTSETATSSDTFQYMSLRGSLWYPFRKKMPMKSSRSLKPNVNLGLLHCLLKKQFFDYHY